LISSENANCHIETLISEFCKSGQNNMGDGTGEKAWADPVVGFAAGDDSVFDDFKTYVGKLHWTPKEIFELAFGVEIDSHSLSVVSWILPQTQETRRDNQQMERYPAERWARSRIFGETFNDQLRRYIEKTLTNEGYRAISPMLAEGFHTQKSDTYQIVSTWSERHIAYACGLGTFGLCDGLITPVGKAVRFGSVVVEISAKPGTRPYKDHREYCLFDSNGRCGECIKRCPAGALSASGHDKSLCGAYLREVTAPHVKSEYGFDGYGCGLCQTGVPCESGIPVD
jgi:epoxyqueuosine reductase